MTTPIIPENQNKDTSWPGLFPKIGQWYSDILSGIVDSFWSIIVLLFGPQDKGEAKGNDGLYLAATILSVFLSMFLLVISFAGSFTAATDYATKNGIDPSVAIWIPVSVDGFIFLAVLVSFGASLVGASAGIARLLILSFTAISIVFNVEHITKTGNADPQHILLGAIFPVVVFLASEVTSHQISAYIKRKDALKTNQVLAEEIEARQQEIIILPQKIDQNRRSMLAEAQASVKAKMVTLNEQRETLLSDVRRAETRLKTLSQKTENIYTKEDLETAHLLGQNPDVTGVVVGKKLNKSVTIGNKQKAKIREALNGVITNGSN